MHFLVLSSSKAILDPDQKHDVCFSEVPFMILQMKGIDIIYSSIFSCLAMAQLQRKEWYVVCDTFFYCYQ